MRVKITQEEVVDRQAVLQIEMDDADMAPYLERTYRKVAQRTNVPGFRKGKAPRSIIESLYGKDNLVSESLGDVLPAATHEAIAEQGLDLAGMPSVEVVDLAPVTIRAVVPLTPKVDLGSYLDIRVHSEPVEVTDEAIDEEIEEMRTRDAAWEPVERPVAFDDRVTADIVGHVDDNVIINSEDIEYLVERDGALPFEGFPGKLVEAESGKPFEFHLGIPGDYVNASFAGKEAHFRVTVKEIKERLLPELDDEFAKGVGDGYDTLGELREDIRARLQVEAEHAEEIRFREAALVTLVEGAAFVFPPLLIDQEVQKMVERRDQFVDSMNITLDDYHKFMGSTEAERLEEMRESAVEQFSRSHALANLAKAEGVEVSDDEIEEKLAEIREAASDDSAKVDESDLDRLDARTAVGASLLMQKAMDRLVEIAKGNVDETTENGEDNADDT